MGIQTSHIFVARMNSDKGHGPTLSLDDITVLDK